MKRLKMTILASAAALLLTALGCKKNSSAADSGGDTAKLLIGAPWKQTKIEWRDTTGNWAEQSMTNLQKLNTMTFFSDNRFSSSGYLSGSGTWQLSGDKKTLTVYYSNGYSWTEPIYSLSSTTLQLSQTINEYAPVPNSNPSKYIRYRLEVDSYSR